jgi:hypothetical protein
VYGRFLPWGMGGGSNNFCLTIDLQPPCCREISICNILQHWHLDCHLSKGLFAFVVSLIHRMSPRIFSLTFHKLSDFWMKTRACIASQHGMIRVMSIHQLTHPYSIGSRLCPGWVGSSNDPSTKMSLSPDGRHLKK